MRRFSYLFLILSVFIFSSCGSIPDSTISSNSGTTNNTITIQGSDTVELNTTSQYTAVLSPANFTTDAINWTVDNNSIGTIDNNGFFTAKNIGTVNIKASAGGVESALFSIKVVTPSAVPVESVIVSPLSPKEVNAGVPEQFYYELMPKNAEYTSVTWSVDNTKIANINKDTGVLTGNTAGTVNVSVTVDNIKSEPYPVKVILPLESISINGPTNVNLLSQATYTVTAVPEGANITNVEWSVNDTTLATIDVNTGILTTGNKAGQVTITAKANGKTTTKLVNITEPIEITGHNITSIGGVITLNVINNKTNNLKWQSSNQAVATVNNGVVTGIGAGTTNITVSEGSNTSNAFAVTIKDVPNGYEVDDTGLHDVYHVYSIDGFKAWLEAVQKVKYTSCYLYSDLDFINELNNTTIDIIFYGTFDGNGHIIKNYKINEGNGFIKSLYKSGIMTNIIFDNATITLNAPKDDFNKYAGIAIRSNDGIIDNVHIKNSKLTVSYDGMNGIGIITGQSYGKIKNSSVTNSLLTVTGKAKSIGGLVGYSFGSEISSSIVENTKISTQGTTDKNGGIGGIVGTMGTNPTDNVTGCGVANTSIINTGIGYTGGISGKGGKNITASYFYGDISGEQSTTMLDYGNFTGNASSIFVKQNNGSNITINGKDSTTLVDDTTVTWEQAVESMNKYLIDKKYTDFAYKYDANKGYPVIEYSK